MNAETGTIQTAIHGKCALTYDMKLCFSISGLESWCFGGNFAAVETTRCGVHVRQQHVRRTRRLCLGKNSTPNMCRLVLQHVKYIQQEESIILLSTLLLELLAFGNDATPAETNYFSMVIIFFIFYYFMLIHRFAVRFDSFIFLFFLSFFVGLFI